MADTTALNGARRIMAIFAHPDDREFFCGETLARWAAESAHAVFVLATIRYVESFRVITFSR